MKTNKKQKRIRRHARVRSSIVGTAARPRLSVYRSNKHIFLQLIDDKAQKTLVGISDKGIAKKKGITKSVLSYETGKLLGEKAHKLGIKKVVFDRGGYVYQGRVRKIAEGAREAGLVF